MKIKVAPSILSADFSKLGEEVKSVEKAGADFIHVDVMDGHFVPNLTIGPLVVKALKKITRLPLDTHLMIENPEKYLPAFAEAGSDIISVHIETCSHILQTIKAIKTLKVRPGVVLNPPTPLEKIRDILADIDLALIMSVNPGFEGQKFIPEVLPKIEELRKLSPGLDIEVDGGINLETAARVIKAGANILVAGSAIFWTENYQRVIQDMKNL